MMPRGIAVAAAALAAALAPCAGLAAQGGGALRFCVVADNLPMSGAQPPGGVEVEIARRLAARLGGEAVLHWLPLSESPEVGVIDGKCDVALGAVTPDPMARERMVPGIALTDAYYAAGYALIRRRDAPPARSLAELGQQRIAVEAVSIPIYTLKQRGHPIYAMDDYDGVVRAVADGRVQYGYLWGPLAAWLLRERDDVVLEREFDPEERWDFALAVREDRVELRNRLNRAVSALVGSGEAGEIFARHGVPYLPPGRPLPASAGGGGARGVD